MYPGFIPHWKRQRCGGRDRDVSIGIGFVDCESGERGFEFSTAPEEGEGGRLSRPGTVAGTVGYMSPEQAAGKKVDGRSDIFSFGAMLYEMVTGRRAFAGNSAAETLAAVLRDQPLAMCNCSRRCRGRWNAW